MASGVCVFDRVKGDDDCITAADFLEVKPGTVQLCRKVTGKVDK